MKMFRGLAGSMLLFAALGLDAAETAVDQTKPENVVSAVFQAAASGKLEALVGLCDPKGENDGDTKRICEAPKADADGQKEFAEWFKTGKLSGEAAIEGDAAEVSFTFGPDGSKSESMRLVLRDGKWYLSSF